MKKLLVGSLILICILSWFGYISVSPNTLDKNMFRQQVEAIESYSLESILLAKVSSQQKTTSPFTSSQATDIARKIKNIQQTLQAQTPDSSISTKYQQIISLTDNLLRQLTTLSSYSGNYHIAQTTESRLKDTYQQIQTIHRSL